MQPECEKGSSQGVRRVTVTLSHGVGAARVEGHRPGCEKGTVTGV